jgi:hypothetical protein
MSDQKPSRGFSGALVKLWRRRRLRADGDGVACDNRTTRAVAKIFREDYKIPRKSIKVQAYWVA